MTKQAGVRAHGALLGHDLPDQLRARHRDRPRDGVPVRPQLERPVALSSATCSARRSRWRRSSRSSSSRPSSACGSSDGTGSGAAYTSRCSTASPSPRTRPRSSSWSPTPGCRTRSGYEVRDGVAYLTDFGALLTNPTFTMAIGHVTVGRAAHRRHGDGRHQRLAAAAPHARLRVAAQVAPDRPGDGHDRRRAAAGLRVRPVRRVGSVQPRSSATTIGQGGGRRRVDREVRAGRLPAAGVRRAPPGLHDPDRLHARVGVRHAAALLPRLDRPAEVPAGPRRAGHLPCRSSPRSSAGSPARAAASPGPRTACSRSTTRSPRSGGVMLASFLGFTALLLTLAVDQLGADRRGARAAAPPTPPSAGRSPTSPTRRAPARAGAGPMTRIRHGNRLVRRSSALVFAGYLVLGGYDYGVGLLLAGDAGDTASDGPHSPPSARSSSATRSGWSPPSASCSARSRGWRASCSPASTPRSSWRWSAWSW